MELNEFITACKTEFAKWGFTATPLTDGEISECWMFKMGVDEVYSIGCDIAAGFTWTEVWAAHAA